MNAHSFETSTANFAIDVLQASQSVPVVVDFWAPWCAPCRALKPVLEKLAAEYGGRFLLAKVNTDQHPEIAGRYGIRGIPSVKAFVDGKLAGEFTGALPEPAVREFIETLLPSPSEVARRAAKADLAAGDFEAAEVHLRRAADLDGRNEAAKIDLAELLIAKQSFEEAEALLAGLSASVAKDPQLEQALARIAVWRKGQSLPDFGQLKARVERHPEDLQARLAYAQRLAADAHYAAAMDELLTVIRGDRGELRDNARKAMLEVFNLASEDGQLVGEYRRRLASALY